MSFGDPIALPASELREASGALDAVRVSIGEVIDMGGSTECPDRPGWAMETLQRLRQVEIFLSDLVARAEKSAKQGGAA